MNVCFAYYRTVSASLRQSVSLELSCLGLANHSIFQKEEKNEQSGTTVEIKRERRASFGIDGGI